MRRRSLLIGLVGGAFVGSGWLLGCAPDTPDSGGEDSDDRDGPVSAEGFIDKVTVGYQGWFAAAGDDSPLGGWSHWAPGTAPAAGKVTFELYPDTREYDAQDLHDTSLGTLRDGRPAKLFGSHSERVVDLHF